MTNFRVKKATPEDGSSERTRWRMGDQAFDWLKRRADIFQECRRVIGTYRVYHDLGKGPIEVTVTVLDAGPDAGLTRYSVEAATDDGRFATGSPQPQVDLALSHVRWTDLGKP
jgi:hypothetical protein